MILYFEVELDDKTNQVLSVKTINPNSVPKPSKKVNTTTSDIILSDNKLELSNNLMETLNLTIGDKIDIYYLEIDGIIKPVVAKSGLFGSSGNKITKSLTISFRQSKHDQLSVYGNCFSVSLDKTSKFGILTPIDGVPKLFKQDLDDVPVPEDIPAEEINLTPQVISFMTLGNYK